MSIITGIVRRDNQNLDDDLFDSFHEIKEPLTKKSLALSMTSQSSKLTLSEKIDYRFKTISEHINNTCVKNESRRRDTFAPCYLHFGDG